MYAVPVLSGTVQVCAVTLEREAYLLLRPEDTVTLTGGAAALRVCTGGAGGAGGDTYGYGAGGDKASRWRCATRDPAALDPSVKATPFARLGRLWTRVSRYFSAYYPEF